MKWIGLAAVVMLAGISGSAAQPDFIVIEVTTTAIDGFTIDDATSAYGEIEFRGGLVLRSPYQHFGAISGLDVRPDGALVAVTDTGFWLTGQLIEEGEWLRGVSDFQMAPMLDVEGNIAIGKSKADAEGLRFDPRDRTLVVSFEQEHRVERFAGELSLAVPIAVPLPYLAGLGSNRGIEAIAIAPAGGPLGDALVIISEAGDDGDGGIRGWVVGGPQAGEFSIQRLGTFSITDAAFLPNGDLFVLERNFSLSEGVGVRIRKLSAADIRPGGVVDGPVVLFDDHLFQIDNMEGISLRELPGGEVLITLVSDNNHSLLQRTLLLQFIWREAIPPDPVQRP